MNTETPPPPLSNAESARFPFVERIKSDRLRGDIQREVSNAEFLLRLGVSRAAILKSAEAK